MINETRHWIYAIIFLTIAVMLLGLIYKISRLEEVNGELRQIKRQYEQICTRYGGNGCE